MGKSLFLRMGLDAGITALLWAAFAYAWTGNLGHEIIGLSWAALVLAHNGLNRGWYKGLWRGAYSPRRVLVLAVNVSLAAAFIGAVASGIMLSRDVLGFLNPSGSLAVRQAHVTCAYWTLVLCAVHAGFHGPVMAAGLTKAFGAPKGAGKFVVRMAGAAVVLWGAYASFKLHIGQKLAGGGSFYGWDGTLAGFLAALASVFALWAAIGYVLVKTEEKK